MVGVVPYVDIQATRSNLDKNNSKNRYREDHQKARTLETIIAGSIRAPDRLYKAGLVDSDKCDHPDCKGERATTKHIMWHCHHYDQVRKPNLKRVTTAIQKARGKQFVHNDARIQAMVKAPCMLHCGICNGDERLYKLRNQIPQEDTLQGFRASGTLPDKYQPIMKQIPPRAVTTTEDGIVFVHWYTDGSTIHGRSLILARSG